MKNCIFFSRVANALMEFFVHKHIFFRKIFKNFYWLCVLNNKKDSFQQKNNLKCLLKNVALLFQKIVNQPNFKPNRFCQHILEIERSNQYSAFLNFLSVRVKKIISPFKFWEKSKKSCFSHFKWIFYRVASILKNKIGPN